MLSVVIPALDAARTIGACLGALGLGDTKGERGIAPESGDFEVVVADGGSTDGTLGIARALGARVVPVSRGRGAQLAAGARAAKGDWLLFLHADTVLEAGWREAVASFRADPANARRAASFRFALDDDRPAARLLETVVGWRCRALGLPYGDQGLIVSRALYDEVGGFGPLPLMEDVDLVRRIGRRRLVVLDVAAVTSAARYRSDGYVARPARNLACLGLYFLGIPPRLIARIYGR
ncbi:MAG: TIGR04283 family arsenosugar biosynthesis glycosyltransferase [Alphaproteobacteria bacterium]